MVTITPSNMELNICIKYIDEHNFLRKGPHQQIFSLN